MHELDKFFELHFSSINSCMLKYSWQHSKSSKFGGIHHQSILKKTQAQFQPSLCLLGLYVYHAMLLLHKTNFAVKITTILNYINSMLTHATTYLLCCITEILAINCCKYQITSM